MKKSRDYVTTGMLYAAPMEDALTEASCVGVALSSQTHPADLPRDYGMAGAVGAYEVPKLATFVQAGLSELLEALPTVDPLAEINTLLDRLLSSQERKAVVAEAFENKVVTLGLRRRSDQFFLRRTLVPRLQAELFATHGRVIVHFTDR